MSNFPTYKSKEIAKSLNKKGFEPQTGEKHHSYYYFYFNGKKTHVNTYLSHDTSKEYSGKKKGLLHDVKNQLKFNKLDDCVKFIDCTFSEQNYIDMLVKKNEL